MTKNKEPDQGPESGVEDVFDHILISISIFFLPARDQ